MHAWQRTTALFLAGLLLLYGGGRAVEAVILAWDRSISSAVLGYRLYYGEVSGQYPTMIDVGDVQSASVGDLDPGETYFFVATAYTASEESRPSNEVAYTEPELPEEAPPELTWMSPPTPRNGSTVPRGRQVMLRVDVSEGVGAVTVRFSVQGQVRCTVIAEPYQCAWTVPTARNKTYRLQATAKDDAGQSGVSTVRTVRTGS